MASVQERLQLKRVAALDKWSTREKLCLASAVSCSGDQNWMSVSRSLKMLCGNNRPTDWFSQKSCAVQYGELLENVETPKRKKRNTSSSSSERDGASSAGNSSVSGSSSVAIAETPTESILRKLTQERISELRALIQRDQEEYVKLREEILLIQHGNLTETQLKEMWADIEKEKEQKLSEQQKYAQWLKEREERKMELQKAWRPSTSQQAQITSPVASTSAAAITAATAAFSQQQLKLNLNIKEEVDTDDSLNSKPGTSPLLTSLLKSPSPAPSTSTGAAVTNPQISNVRVTAPTITNLLTGNNTQIQQIASTSTTTVGTVQFNQPLVGPISIIPHPQISSTTPSKSAPTLSMLLEKNKENSSAAVVTGTAISESISSTSEIKNEPIESISQKSEPMDVDDDGNSTNKDEDQQLMDVFNGLIPDNIDELADILTNNNAIILNPELLEEESILENVESLIDDEEQGDELETKENIQIPPSNVKKSEMDEQTQDDVKNTKVAGIIQQTSLNEIKIKEEILQNSNATISTSIKNESTKTENDSDTKETIERKDNVKVEEKETTNNKDQKEEDNLDEKNKILERDTSNSNQLKSEEDKKVKKQDKNDDNEEKMIKSENLIAAEISDDSSDNTSLQVLKDKITTNATTLSPKYENKNLLSSSASKVKVESSGEKSKLSLSLVAVEKKEEDIVMNESNENVSNTKNDIVDLEEMDSNSMVIRNKSDNSSFVHQQNQKKEENSRNEVEIAENNSTITGNVNDDDEQKIIVIQEDDDSTSGEKIISTANKKLDNENLQKDSSEKVEISNSDNQQEQNKLLQDASDEKSSVNMDDETKTVSEVNTEHDSISTSTALSSTNMATESKSKDNDNNRNSNTNDSSITSTLAAETTATTTIIIDTDEESPVEIIKDDVAPRTKRDYSRKRLDLNSSTVSNSSTTLEKKSEEPPPSSNIVSSNSGVGAGEESITTINRQNLSIKRLKERERSESPLVDDENLNDSMPRTRRRYSSTPIFDSIPNSPASSDDKEYRAWKKSILMIYNRLTIHKNASIFLRPVTEDVAPNYKQIVHRPMDLQTIKRNIETGVIRTTAEFQRDVMLMCQNAIMYNQTNNNVYNMAKEMWTDSVNVIETFLESVKKDALESSTSRSSNNTTSNSKSRSRKSNRLP